jgi:phosphoglycolate phosphatase-like HAD superfamily hydrolase
VNTKNTRRLYREIVPALELLERRKVHRAIITGKGEKATGITLATTGLDKWFPLVITGSCTKSPKPNPEGIFRALDKLEVPPVEAFYLGDSPRDVETSHRAGVLSLAALWGSHEKEAVLAQRPDYAFYTPGQFFAWLQQNS